MAAELIASAGGEDPGWTCSAEVLEALAGKVKEYEGLTEDGVGLLGVGHVHAEP